jgi:hypothetical protein
VPDPEPDRGGGEPRSLDDWLRSFASDASLRPVLLVAAGCFGAIGAGALLLAVQSHSLPAIAALALLAFGSADLFLRDLRRRRFGPASRAVVALWLLSAVAAAAAVWSGLA